MRCTIRLSVAIGAGLALLACIPSASGSSKPADRVSFHGRVAAVSDGQNITVRTRGGRRVRVRLLGVDGPRLSKKPRRLQCGAKEAKSNLLYGVFTRPRDTNGDGLVDRPGGTRRRVAVGSDPTQPTRDRAGRLLAYVKTTEEFLDSRQIRYGHARPRYPNAHARRSRRMRRLLSVARKERDGEGVWSLCGGKFHRKAARKGRKPTAAERQRIGALADGYVRAHLDAGGLAASYTFGRILVSRRRPIATARLLIPPARRDEADDGFDDESRDPLILNLASGDVQGPVSNTYCAPADVRDELGVYCH